MTIPLTALDTWQHRLEAHFSALAAEKASHGVPVFALEHGLSASEVDTLKRDVRESLKSHSPRQAQELPWIVYAAEFGYAYAGEEYWPSFEAETALWRSSSRHWVRDAFHRFSKKYNGAEPAGRWADFFSIISWPITHGILPRDLQRQLARLLFDARVTFRPDLIHTAPALGQHLRELSYARSARFQQFAENSTLLGQIAASLLLQDKNEDSWILPSALTRIVDDIGRERSAREWLDEARAAARLEFKGLKRLSAREGSTGASHANDPGTSREASLATMLEPVFFLRQIDANVWQVLLTVPGLRELAAQRPHVRQFLARSQAIIGGLGGRTVGRSYFLNDSAPTTRLGVWPTADMQLVRFDSTPPDIALLLDSVSRGRSGDSWLFRINVTGDAREIRSRVVHPGESYVFITNRPYEHPAQILKKVRIECEGAFGLRLDIPAVVEEPWLTILKFLKLSLVSTIRVWPAGLPNPNWSGDGTAEWLSGDEIILGLEADYQFSRLDVALRSRGSEESRTLAVGKGKFLSLGKLSPGKFNVEFAAEIDDPGLPVGSSQSVLHASLTLVVRLPRDTGAAAESGILRLVVHPHPPSLEDIWEGRCEMLLTAPTQRISAKVCFLVRGRDEPVFERVLPNLPIPLDTARWNLGFSNHVRRGGAESFYDDASACRIEFSAGELGSATIIAEREFVPIRWAASESGSRVKLINLTGSEAEVSSYECGHPDAAAKMTATDIASQVYQVPGSGALFLATLDSTRAGIVVVPPQAFRSFSQLASRPTVSKCRLDPRDLESLLLLAASWERSRISGSVLAATYRSKAVDALIAELFGTVCGENWARVERKIIDGGGGVSEHLSEAKSSVTNRRDESGIAAAIALRKSGLLALSPEARAQILSEVVLSFTGVQALTARRVTPPSPSSYSAHRSIASGQGGTNPSFLRIAEFALRLATSPAEALDFAKGDVRNFLNALLERPLIARAARFMVFSIATVSETDREWVW